MNRARKSRRAQTGAVAIAVAVLAAACSGQVGSPAGPEGAGAGRSPSGRGPGGSATPGPGGRSPGGPETWASEPSACSAVGVTPLQRLTRVQYKNTVRDLLGVDATVADGFDPDGSTGTFSSNTVAPVQDVQVEQYVDAAQALAGAADVTKLVDCAGAEGAACARTFIERFGLHAFRRPLGADEVDRLQVVFDDGHQESFEAGIRGVLEAMLASPHFLYRIEPIGKGAASGVEPFALASRLSYFLWQSKPDAALFEAAGKGRLGTVAGIREEVTRMLADPRAQQSFALFHREWLGVTAVEGLEKDNELFPDFLTAMRPALNGDFLAFVDQVMADGGRISDLFTAAPAKLHPAFAPTAGAPARKGILAMPAFLAAHAHADQSSPVLRGVVVRENVFCTDLAPPPVEVNNTPPEPVENVSTRERFAKHREDPSCAACHSLIDDLGFAFESYDAVSRARLTDGQRPVDTKGTLIGTDVDGAFDGLEALQATIARSRQATACVARHWLRFALGRLETDQDRCALEALEAALPKDATILDVVTAVAANPAFRYSAAP